MYAASNTETAATNEVITRNEVKRTLDIDCILKDALAEAGAATFLNDESSFP